MRTIFAALLAVVLAKPKYDDSKQESNNGLPDLDFTQFGKFSEQGSRVGGSSKKNVCQAFDAKN